MEAQRVRYRFGRGHGNTEKEADGGGRLSGAQVGPGEAQPGHAFHHGLYRKQGDTGLHLYSKVGVFATVSYLMTIILSTISTILNFSHLKCPPINR